MIDPNYNLNGVYSPIYLGEHLFKFINSVDKFGSIDPTDDLTNLCSAKLIDLLPFLKSGICLQNSLFMLFYIYIYNNNLKEEENLQYFHFDENLTKLFVDMTCEFYKDVDHPKILMSEAIDKQIIDHYFSTQDVIRLNNHSFNIDKKHMEINRNGEITIIHKRRIANYYISLLCYLNYYSKDDLKRLNKNRYIGNFN